MEIQVTAAIFLENGKYLICQRSKDDNLPLLWEFPGGKMEADETLEECIVRECKEELDVEINVVDIFGTTTYTYSNKQMIFTFFNVEKAGGELTAKVHEQIKWVTADEMKKYKFCPADIEIVEKIMRRA